MSSETVLQRIEPLRAPPPAPIAIRPLHLRDRAALHQLLTKDGLFTREEIAVALELIDGALAEPGGEYRVLVADRAGAGVSLAGYVCYGPTPMTEGTWDLYWIVTHPGCARAAASPARSSSAWRRSCARLGARLVRVETSRLDGYGAARAFYERLQLSGVRRAARLLSAGRRSARHAQAALSDTRYTKRVTRLACACFVALARRRMQAHSRRHRRRPRLPRCASSTRAPSCRARPSSTSRRLTATARSAIASSSGVPVREDGGVDSNRPRRYRLRVELEIGAAEDLASARGNLRALVDAKLSPIGGDPSALSFEQTALAERAYTPGKPGEPAWQAHAEHAIRDCVGGVGARVKLAAGDAHAIVAAIDGPDDDLRDEGDPPRRRAQGGGRRAVAGQAPQERRPRRARSRHRRARRHRRSRARCAR